MHLPVDFHWFVTFGTDIVNEAETDERAGVAEAVPFVLAYKKQELLAIFLLLDKTLAFARMRICILRLPMKRKPPVKYVFSAISSSSIFVPKNKTYDDTRRSCRNYYVL